MKITLVILLSIAMALTQSVFTAQSSDRAAASCACSGCTKNCCIENDAPVPQPPTPVLPVSRGFESQIFLAVLAQVIALTPAPAQVHATAFSSSPLQTIALPLYQRNCSYLI
jgi:hypothetical protein